MTLTREQSLLLLHAAEYAPVAEYRFCASRRYRLDVAFVAEKLGVEIQGGGWIHGRHSRGAGMEQDAEKSALLAILGWRVIYCTPRQVSRGIVWGWIQQCLATHK